jgi:hypothetical protein
VYTFLLWFVFALMVTPGYITYKKRTFSLEGKINELWSRTLGGDGRTRIQNALGCCGYYSPFVEAAVTQTCYSRSTLPGCKNQFLHFERLVLGRWYIVAFALVPLQIGAIVVGLLCSNHVTYRFGKGMTPKAYRLDMNSMAVIMDNYARYAVLHTFSIVDSSQHHTPFSLASLQSNTAKMLPPMSLPGRDRIFISISCPRLITTAIGAERPPTRDPDHRYTRSFLFATPSFTLSPFFVASHCARIGNWMDIAYI